MLAAIGVKSIEELFSSIPEAYRLKKPLNLPGPLSETEVIQYFRSVRRKIRWVIQVSLVLAFTRTCAP